MVRAFVPVLFGLALLIPAGHTGNIKIQKNNCPTKEELLPKFRETFETVYWVDSGFLNDYWTANEDIRMDTGKYAAYVPIDITLASYAILYRPKGSMVWWFSYFKKNECVMVNWPVANWRHARILEKLVEKNKA